MEKNELLKEERAKEEGRSEKGKSFSGKSDALIGIKGEKFPETHKLGERREEKRRERGETC